MASQVIQCGTACTVTVELAAAPPSSDNLVDIGTVFALFLGAAAVIFMAKQVLKVFMSAPHDND